jgi:hypothetical protein
MSNSPSPVVANALEKWHAGVASKDTSGLTELLHPDVAFRSPMVFKPYEGVMVVALILSTVLDVFEDFEYHREFFSADGQEVVLEFSASVGDKSLKGVDIVRFDAEGRITAFEVMVRPFNGLQALGAEMGNRLGEHLAAYKAARKDNA